MKVIHLNYSDNIGGAARATYRIHKSLEAAGVDSRLWVNQATLGDWTVEGPKSLLNKVVTVAHPRLLKPIVAALKTENKIVHSPQILPSSWVNQINASDADVVNLHWVQGEMLSIAAVGRIKKPLVWTLHDMWAFCGAEHYTEEFRWREGYYRHNRPAYESGFDLNRWTWTRKNNRWTRPIQIVAPSHWLAQCVRESALMRYWPIDVIHYPIDTDWWEPVESNFARELLHLPKNVPILLFGAMNSGRNPRKGFDLLSAALSYLKGKVQQLELVIFGQFRPRHPQDLGFPVHYLGNVYDDVTLRALYSAADVFALPSRQDNLPLTSLESIACGTPVVAFDIYGPPSMVKHKKTGFLAKAFDPVDFAAGIQYLLQQGNQRSQRKAVREYARENFSPAVVARQYIDVYQKIENQAFSRN